jgi:hypothetical protein
LVADHLDAALARCFVEHHGTRSRYVQRTNAASHGDAQQVVAGAADEVVETGAFTAQDEDAVAGEIELVVVGCAALVESDDPDVLALKFFERANQVDDPRDAEMFSRACAGLGCGRADWSRAPFGEDNAIDSRTVGYSQEGSKILRVFNTIKREEKTGRAGMSGGGLEQILKGQRFLRTNQRDHALMRGGSGKLSELFARFLANTHASLTAFGHEAREPVILALESDNNVIKAATASLERLLHRMKAVENFHALSLDCR